MVFDHRGIVESAFGVRLPGRRDTRKFRPLLIRLFQVLGMVYLHQLPGNDIS